MRRVIAIVAADECLTKMPTRVGNIDDTAGGNDVECLAQRNGEYSSDVEKNGSYPCFAGYPTSVSREAMGAGADGS